MYGRKTRELEQNSV